MNEVDSMDAVSCGSEKEEPPTTLREGKAQQDKTSVQNESGSIQVVICDDCPTIRHGLQRIFDTAPEIEVVLSTSSYAEILSKLDDLDIDIILVDIEDESHAVAEYLTNIREKLPDAKILVFTDCEDHRLIVDALELGIEGFQCKQDADANEIVDTIFTLHRGGKDLAPCVTEALLTRMKSEQQKSQVQLSAREQDVLDLIAQGKTNNDIADKLYISVRTVKFHVSSILAKLDVKNRTEAALWLL
jgi:NarL family two-component system response regulator LiaR